MRYEAPESLEGAVALLAGAKGETRVLAGGTDLLVQMRADIVEPDLIVDIKKIPETRAIAEEKGGWRIGAAVTGAELKEHPRLKKVWPGVIEAANLIGSTQVQGRATMGGNLCNGSPAADSVPALIAAGAVATLAGPNGKRDLPVEDVMLGAGLYEAYTPSLVAEDPNPKALRIPEPQSSEQAVLRTRLLPSLVEAARYNLDAGNTGIRLFEIARVYLPTGGKLADERWTLGAVVGGGFARAKGVVETLYDTLGIEPRFERGEDPLLHPGKTARVEAGVLGELRPGLLDGEWGAFELDLSTLLAEVPERPPEYEDVISYPAVHQDLAFIVPEEVAAGDLIKSAREAAGSELHEMRVFDVYRGDQVAEGRKSLAFSVSFQSPERTLSDEDARVLRERIVGALAEQFGAELRA